MTNPTIKDIANLCGVSVSTVSRAINDSEGISSKTRNRILKTIKEVGYEPDTNARNLKISKNKIISVLIKGITNPFFTPMIKVIEEEISKTGYAFVLNKVEENSSEVDVAQKMVKILKPEGIIFLGGFGLDDQEKLKSLDIPYSMTTIVDEKYIGRRASYVGIDDFRESYKMVNYLIGLGHKKIALIAAREDDRGVGKLRLEGYKKALADNNLSFDPSFVIYPPKGLNPYSLQNGYGAVKKILNDNLDPTAIFAISDLMAIGAIKALNDMGKKVPEDYSVAGFDGLEINEFLQKPITTIVQPTSKIAYTSVKELFNIINKNQYKQVTSFDSNLFIGQTAAKL